MNSKVFRVKRISGFTLIELSIVLLVIGLIVSAVVGGKKLIVLSNLTKARELTNSSPVNGIEDLFLWLDSTAKYSFNTVPVDGASISNWNDINPQLTVKGNAVQASSPSQPTYTASAINGLPAISFNGSTFMTSKSVTDWLFFQQGTDHTYFIVFKTTSSHPNAFIMPISTANADLNSGIGMDFIIEDRTAQSASQQVRATVSTGSGVATYEIDSANNAIDLSKANIVTVKFKNAGTGTDANLYVNGVLKISGSSSIANNTSASSNSTMYIGADYQTAYPLTGYIGEIIIFKRQLSDFERGQVEFYLSKKWNIKLP